MMSGSSSDTPAWSVMLSQTDKAGFAFVHEPVDTESKLISFLRAAQENHAAVVIGKPARVPPSTGVKSVVYLDLAPMSSVLEHERADQVICVQAGMTIEKLNSYLAEHHQWWPVAVPNHWTVGEVIAHGAGGALQHRFGGPRDMVLGGRAILGDGQALSCGGRVVKNVTGYDMTKLFIGSHCCLGVMENAFLRVYALPESSRTLMWNFESSSALFAAAGLLNNSGLPLSCLEIATADVLNDVVPGFISGPANSTNDGSTFVILAQVHGSPDVVSEVSHAATELLVGNTPVELAPADESSVWTMVAECYSHVSENTAEVAIPFSEMERLAVHDKFSSACFGGGSDAKVFQWMYRPHIGRLVLRGQHLGNQPLEQNSVITILRSFCGSTAEPIKAAICDTEYNYRIVRMPNSDPILDQLQQQLKKRFDPSGILSPFVQLQVDHAQ